MASLVYGRIPYPVNFCQLGQGGSEFGGIGEEEIGEGDVLPDDSSEYELFRLEGHATLPDGLYSWSEINGVWIQA